MTNTSKPLPDLPADGPDSGPRQHDMGGVDADAIDTEDHGLLFWERQANGLRMVMVDKKLVKLDELRRCAEDLPDYYRLSYFERTTKAIRNILLEKGHFTEAELEAKMQEIADRFSSAGISETAAE